MKEFFVTVAEYPFTSLFLAFCILTGLEMIFNTIINIVRVIKNR